MPSTIAVLSHYVYADTVHALRHTTRARHATMLYAYAMPLIFAITPLMPPCLRLMPPPLAATPLFTLMMMLMFTDADCHCRRRHAYAYATMPDDAFDALTLTLLRC